MKEKKVSNIISFSIPFIFIVAFLIRCNCGANAGRKRTFNEVIGSYILDIKKTKLGNEYTMDSNTYKTLVITFFADSTFKMNKRVPFMYDSSGLWKAGNVNEWCWLLFDNFKYNSYTENSGSQFTRPFKEGADTFFLINAATPQDNQQTISDIYFKKIKHQK